MFKDHGRGRVPAPGTPRPRLQAPAPAAAAAAAFRPGSQQKYQSDPGAGSSTGGFVPNLNAITSSQNLQWMVQPTIMGASPGVPPYPRPYHCPHYGAGVRPRVIRTPGAMLVPRRRYSEHDFARHYLEKKALEEPGCELETKAGLLSPEDGPTVAQGESVNLSNGNVVSPGQEDLACPSQMINGSRGTAPPKPSVRHVLRKIWQLALCIIMTFSVTLSVFPAITAGVASTSGNRTWRKFFTPVCCFLLFNVMDWLGRSATSYFHWPDRFLHLLPAVVGLRLLFVPLLLLCNIPQRAHLPTLFQQDAWFVLFMVVFSVSNGYFVSLSMCLAPKQVQPHESELAGAIMTFFLALGLSCGAALSFVLKALL